MYVEIIERLQEAGVEFVIIGGVAVNLQGYIRYTGDLDIALKLESDNLLKAIDVIMGAGFTTWLPVDPREIADEVTRRDWIEKKEMKALTFKRDKLKVDIVFSLPIQFKDMRRENFRVGRFLYPVPSKEDLVKMKENTGRPMDRIDVDRLKILIELEKEGHGSGSE